MQLTELCSVTSQICTNTIACTSVNPSQLDLDRASFQNVNKHDKPAPVYVAEAAFLTGQDQRKITNRQWNFKAMCALKPNPCDRHKVTVSSLTKLDNYPSKLQHGPPCRVGIQGSVSLKFATKWFVFRSKNLHTGIWSQQNFIRATIRNGHGTCKILLWLNLYSGSIW